MTRGKATMITDLFVYGTLKRGECRESMWPRKPICIREGFILARLYDLGPYPAIRVEESGDPDDDSLRVDKLDWVRGELWSFSLEDVAPTITILDEIEQTNQHGDCNLYDHVLVRVFDRPNSRTSQLALAYQFSSTLRLDQSRRLGPRDGDKFISWSAGTEER